MNKIKRLFQEACISLHEERYPQFKDRLKVYDSVARGFVLNHNTTVNETMSNHPWTYTGVLVCRTPENLPNGQGDLVFIDPLPTSDYNDKHGISSSQLGTMAIFPGWLKYRLSPIRKEQGTYDTVMLLVMNAMIVHTQNEEHLQKEIEDIKRRSFETSKPMIKPNDGNKDDIFQLDPISQDKGEIEIGEYTTRPVPGNDTDNDKDIGSQ